MTDNTRMAFGDNVRVRVTPETIKAGLAGCCGSVYGETTPSGTQVEVIGNLENDYAINVFFEQRQNSYWFSPNLLEFIDHAPGTEITLKGIKKKWVRAEQGAWKEIRTGKLHNLWNNLAELFTVKKE